METPVLTIGLELLSNGWFSQTDLGLATELPSWKISRLMSRFEVLGFVKVGRGPVSPGGDLESSASSPRAGSSTSRACSPRKPRRLYEVAIEGARFEVR